LANLSQIFPILSDLKCYRVDLLVIKHVSTQGMPDPRACRIQGDGSVVSGVKTKLEPLLLTHLTYNNHGGGGKKKKKEKKKKKKMEKKKRKKTDGPAMRRPTNQLKTSKKKTKTKKNKTKQKQTQTQTQTQTQPRNETNGKNPNERKHEKGAGTNRRDRRPNLSGS